jgi:PKD repeat protein
MRFIGRILPFIVLLLEQINLSHASHSMGADLTYQCLGSETYQLTLSFYRDCSGIDAPSSVTIDVQSASCGINTSITLQPIAGTGQEITPICPTAKTTCNGGSYTGIEEWVYQGTFTLPIQCDDWLFSYSTCCRNAAITTISSPDVESMYVEAHLDNKNVSCNSSPTFSNKPVPFVCLGEIFCFNHGAIDLDGDSLVYSLVTPKTSSTAIVNYYSGYSANSPLQSSPVLTFNTQTGDFCVTPNIVEVTVMAVLVQEFRNGILIGSVIRDIQVTIDNCNNENPKVDGINGSGKFDTSVCAGTQLCFVTNSSDADAGQSVSMSWNAAISGATFNASGGTYPSGTFCWTPQSSDASTIPYCFTVEVKDDYCPSNGIQVYSFCITVEGLTVDAGSDQSISCINTTTLNGSASGGSGSYTYVWSSGDSGQSTMVGQGTYLLSVDDGAGCLGEDSVKVTYYDAPVADLTYSSGCSNPVNFTDASTISGGPSIVSWQWNFGDGNSSSQQNTSNSYNSSGIYTVSLIATSSLGCADTVTKSLTINPAPIAAFNSTIVCQGQATDFTDQSSVSNSNIISWQWDFGDGNADNIQNPSHLYDSAGIFNATLIITTDSNCTDQLSQTVEVSTSPLASFTVNDICLNEDAVMTNTSTISTSTIASYSWDFGDGSTSASP